MKRTPEEQKIHDMVLADSAKSYLAVTTAENIKTNAGGQEIYEIEGFYPDLVAKLPTGEIIIEEVETESTINEQEKQQWRRLSALGYDFRLIVPLNKLETVKPMVADLTVNVQAYEVTGGQIHWFGKNT